MLPYAEELGDEVPAFPSSETRSLPRSKSAVSPQIISCAIPPLSHPLSSPVRPASSKQASNHNQSYTKELLSIPPVIKSHTLQELLHHSSAGCRLFVIRPPYTQYNQPGRSQPCYPIALRSCPPFRFTPGTSPLSPLFTLPSLLCCAPYAVTKAVYY